MAAATWRRASGIDAAVAQNEPAYTSTPAVAAPCSVPPRTQASGPDTVTDVLIPERPAGSSVCGFHVVPLFVRLTVTVIGSVVGAPNAGPVSDTTSYWPGTPPSATTLPLLNWPLPQLITAEKALGGFERLLGSNVAIVTPVAGWFSTTDTGATTRFVIAPASSSRLSSDSKTTRALWRCRLPTLR